MRTSKNRIVPKHRNSASKAHFTPRQRELKASWESRRDVERGRQKADKLKHDLALKNAGVEFHELFKRATGEEPTIDLINAYCCSGANWYTKLKEIERHTWGSEDDGIRPHVEAEVRRARKNLSARRSLRQIYCEVAERLNVHADTFEAAIKRVENAYKFFSRAKPIGNLGVVGRMAIEVQEGLRILDPQTMKPMFPGRIYDVPNSPYWRRHLREGGVRKISI